MLKKILVSTILTFLSIIATMKLLISLNKGDLVLNTLAIAGVVNIIYLVIKTRVFTNFNFKKNEKNS
jgi:hypothetical protein